jgi:two-component system CheB/CheR fusion protein
MGKAPTVLIVDDDSISADVCSQAVMLRYADATIHIARTGKECLSVLEKVTPDVVLMDLKLPIMDGWETLRNIRANSAFDSLPVIALTGYHSASVAQDVKEAGFTAYVPKPIDLEILNQTLDGIIG